MLIIPIKDGENIDRALKRYKRKFDKVMNNLINYIFILNMWQKVDEENTIKERTM